PVSLLHVRLSRLSVYSALSPLSPHSLFFFTHTPPPPIYTLSLHDALPIFRSDISQSEYCSSVCNDCNCIPASCQIKTLVNILLRSEEHTSELQSRFDLVCRLLLEKKKKKKKKNEKTQQSKNKTKT